MLGTILAYKGAKVVIIDAGTHPRFALGESTVRHTFRMIKIMAERFGVPEFKTEFNSGEQLHKHVSNRFGVKKNFGFVYHRPGEHQRPAEATQLVIPPYREGFEAHLFRQDTDQYLDLHRHPSRRHRQVQHARQDRRDGCAGCHPHHRKRGNHPRQVRRRCFRRRARAGPPMEPARRSAARPAADAAASSPT